MTQAGWYADPLARAQVRYWDGAAWSPWVADDGASRVDAEAALAGLPPPTDLAPPVGPSAFAWVPAPVAAFRSLRGLAVALTWVLSAAAVADVATALILFHRLDLVARYLHGDLSLIKDLHDADDAVSGASTVAGLLQLAVLVLVIVFLYRASTNTRLWSTTPERWSPGWAIGCWFIPLANFVIPFLVVRDIWRRSVPDRSLALVWWWWVLFVAGVLVRFVDPGDSTLHDIRVRDGCDIAGGFLLAAAAVVLIVLLRRLSAAQHARAEPVRV
jgi:hypothetical protein